MGRSFDAIIYQSWWVVLVAIVCFAAYEQSVRQQEKSYDRLFRRLAQLEAERDQLLTYQQDLLLQIRSQGDPAWVELTLMRVLGVAPEGQRKAFFSDEGER